MSVLAAQPAGEESVGLGREESMRTSIKSAVRRTRFPVSEGEEDAKKV